MERLWKNNYFHVLLFEKYSNIIFAQFLFIVYYYINIFILNSKIPDILF